jgi:hypothetical protein
MPRLMFSVVSTGIFALASVTGRSRVQSDPYAKLIGTWSIDSMNGSGDLGLPKSQTVAFTRSGAIVRVAATTDDGQGPSTLLLDCSSATHGATRDLGSGQIARCRFRPTADSVMYTLVIRKNGQTIASEHGRLVVSPSGDQLRDEYDATTKSGQPGHYRHVYSKK